MLLKSLQLKPWRQFQKVDIEFSSEMTILTGVNGCGKTTLLGILGRLFQNFVTEIITTPIKLSDGRTVRPADLLEYETEPRATGYERGRIGLSNGADIIIKVPNFGGPAYPVDFDGFRSLDGIFMPSRRPPLFYQQTDTISIVKPDLRHSLTSYFKGYERLYNGSAFKETSDGQSAFKHPMLSLKETLISLGLYANGMGGDADPSSRKAFDQFQDILKQMLSPIGFEELKLMIPDVLLKTKNSTFSIEAASGGVSAVIELVWPIFLCLQFSKEITVVIDEPENHLHPSMQQQILPNLIKTFPQVQFVIATHSPLIVSSVKNAAVYALHPDYVEETNGIVSSKISSAKRPLTPNSVLRDILGMEQTLPFWASIEIERITNQFSAEDFSPDAARKLHSYLDELGLAEQMSAALQMILKPKK